MANCSATMECKTACASSLYNLVQDVGVCKLILDCRNRNAYQEMRVKTSISVPIDEDSNNVTLQSIENILSNQDLQQFKRRHLLYKVIILVADDTELVKHFASLLLCEPNTCVKHVYILQGMENNCWQIVIDTFATFSTTYPFVCSNSVQRAFPYSLPCEIIPQFLYLGSCDHAKMDRLRMLSISHVLNVAEEVDDTDCLQNPNEFSYCKLNIADTVHDNILTILQEALQFLHAAKNQGKRVLVHCNMGISRSTSIVIAYLLDCKIYKTFDEAFAYCKSCRR